MDFTDSGNSLGRILDQIIRFQLLRANYRSEEVSAAIGLLRTNRSADDTSGLAGYIVNCQEFHTILNKTIQETLKVVTDGDDSASDGFAEMFENLYNACEGKEWKIFLINALKNQFIILRENSQSEALANIIAAFSDKNVPLLHIAAQEENPRFLKWLLKNGLAQFRQGSNGEVPLFCAAQEGNVRCLQTLLNHPDHKQQDAINSLDRNNNNVLHVAVQARKCAVIDELMKQPAALQLLIQKNNEGQTPLLLAESLGYEELKKNLLKETPADSFRELGLDPRSDPGLAKQIILAAKWGNYEKFRGQILTLAHSAASKGNVEYLKFLVEKGDVLDAEDENCCTPAYAATYYGQLECLELLAARGADLNKADKNGVTPAYVAAHNGQLECLRYLASRGVDLNQANKKGFTQAYVASKKGHLPCLELIESRGE